LQLLWFREEEKGFKEIICEGKNWRDFAIYVIFLMESPQFNFDDQIEAMRPISFLLELSAGVLHVTGSRVSEFILVGILAHVTIIEELSAVFAVSRIRGSWRWLSRWQRRSLEKCVFNCAYNLKTTVFFFVEKNVSFQKLRIVIIHYYICSMIIK